MKTNNKLALAIACACATSAWAETINVNTLARDQLQKYGKIAQIYQKQTGKPLPPGVTPNVIFEGDVGGRGLKVAFPQVIPERPLVLKTQKVNCLAVDSTIRATVEKESKVMTTFSNSDTVESKKELAVTVGYESPFGASASATATVSQTLTANTTKGGGTEDTLKWAEEISFQAAANKLYNVQFVVTEQYVERVSYTANLVLSGPVSINFLQGQEGFAWVKVQGSKLPSNVIRPGSQQNNRRLAVCRTFQNNRMRIGKSEGTTCWYGIHEMTHVKVPFNLKSGKSTGDFEILVGAESSVQLVDPYAKDAYLTDDASRQQVCFAQHKGWSLPGYVEGRNCVSEWDSYAVMTQDYKVLRAAQAGGTTVRVMLEEQLPDPAQRTFDLRGYFTAVHAVSGDFRIDEGPACPAKPKPAMAASAASAAAPGKPAAVQTVKLEDAPPNTPALPASKVVKKTLPQKVKKPA